MVELTNNTRKISFVIPALNEAESLPELIDGIRANVPEDMTYEIIIVNDGSTDNTEEVIHSIAADDPNVHMITFRKNFGKALALETGFRESTGDIIISMDGDLQDDPAEIPKFIEKLDEGYDLVSGWKKDRQDPLEKRLPSKFFNAIVSRMSGVKLHDFNCGFKAYNRSVVESIDLYGDLHRFIPCLAARRGFRIAEIPVHHNKRTHGRSKYGIERYLHGLFDALTVFYLTHFEEQPMYLFGRLGLLSGFIGMIICLYLTVLKIMGNPIGQRPLLLLGILLVITGVQLFSLGLLGESFVKINHRSKHDESHIKYRI